MRHLDLASVNSIVPVIIGGVRWVYNIHSYNQTHMNTFAVPVLTHPLVVMLFVCPLATHLLLCGHLLPTCYVGSHLLPTCYVGSHLGIQRRAYLGAAGLPA